MKRLRIKQGLAKPTASQPQVFYYLTTIALATYKSLKRPVDYGHHISTAIESRKTDRLILPG